MTEQPMGTQDQGESFVASEGQAEAQEPIVEQSSAPEPEQSGGHPAWQEILGAVPEMFHGAVRPTLEKWDKGVQEKLEAERQQWADYQFIRENQLTPDTIQYALQMLGSLQSDPRAFYEQMGRHYNFVSEAPAQAQPGEYDFSEYGDEPQQEQTSPEVAQLKQQMEQMAQLLYQQQQKEQEAAEDAALEKELAGLRQKYGEYDENYVLGLMANGQDGESAVRAYKELESKLRGNGNGQATPPPKVMGTGGAAPASGAVDPKKLDAKGRKDLAIQMLEAQQRLGA